MIRVKTGIKELDNMTRGGFLEGDSILVTGSAGLGKTLLGLQFLVAGITQHGENGLCVSFEQLPDRIYRDAKNFGWDLRKLEEENKLRVICTSPNLLLESEGSEHLLDEAIREVHPRRIVIDSISHLGMFVPQGELRKETYRLIMYLKTKNLTSMLIHEAPRMLGTNPADGGLGFIVDCIIMLRFVEIESAMKRMLAVLKMRGSDHQKTLREYKITSTGLKIHSPFKQYDSLLTGSPRKIPEESFTEAFIEATAKNRG